MNKFDYFKFNVLEIFKNLKIILIYIFEKNRKLKLLLLFLTIFITINANILFFNIIDIEYLKGLSYAIIIGTSPLLILFWIISCDCDENHKKLKRFFRIYLLICIIFYLITIGLNLII